MRSLARKMKIVGGKRCRACVLIALTTVIIGVIYLGYFCPDQVCALSSGSPTPQYKTPLEAYLKGELSHQAFADSSLSRDYDFDIEGEDVLVFLHIQKTGGTSFGRHLVRDVQLAQPCMCSRGRKRCNCYNSEKKIWLFSRYSTGWICGLHADWTELQDCVNSAMDKWERGKRRRRYLYITILRDPVQRYLSEWKHVQRGSTWLAARLKCNGRQATLEEVPFCFTGENWSGVSLDAFGKCPHNLARNRQTRMLANLSMVGCYNHSVMSEDHYNQVLLQSAKDNLRNMAFFGLTEYQQATQYMFEHTFRLKFLKDFEQRNITHATQIEISTSQTQRILELNKLDIELYQFAKDLFFQRLKKMQEEEGLGNRTSSRSDVGEGGMLLAAPPHHGQVDPQTRYGGATVRSRGETERRLPAPPGESSRIGGDQGGSWRTVGDNNPQNMESSTKIIRRRKKGKRKHKKISNSIA